MKRFVLLLAALSLLVPSVSGARRSRGTLPPMCTAATLLTTCVPQLQGVRARVSDGDNDNDDCTGGGTTVRVCEFDGTTWQVVNSAIWTGAFGDQVFNESDGVYVFDRDEPGDVTLRAGEAGSADDLVLEATGTSPTITIGSQLNTDVTNLTDTVTIQNLGVSRSLTLDFRDYADTDDDDMAHGLIVVNCSGTDTGAEECNMDLSITTGGANVEVLAMDPAGGIALGDATTTVITLTTDDTGDGTDLVVPADSINASELNSADVCGTLLYSSIDPTEAGATDDYMSFRDHAGSTTEANEDDFWGPAAMLNVHSLHCDIDADPGVGKDAWTITLRKDSGDTALTCVIDEAAFVCNSSGVVDLGGAGGALLNLSVDSAVGGGDDPDAAGELFCSLCLAP